MTKVAEDRDTACRPPHGPSCPPGELVRMLEWAEGRLEHLEGELTADGIAEALRDRKLFPEVEDLVVHNIEESA